MSRNVSIDHRHRYIEHAPILLEKAPANNDAEPVFNDIAEPVQRSVREFRVVPASAASTDSDEALAPDYRWPNRRSQRRGQAQETEPSPRITPRIAAPHQSRPLLRWSVTGILTAALLAGAAWGFITLRDPATLPIRAVKVEGHFTHVTAQALQQAVADAATGGFLSVDVDAIRRAALSLPWVHSVVVRRVWPDTLRLTVTEQVAVARWGEVVPGVLAQGLINSGGEVFMPDPASFPPGLPELRGPAGTGAVVLAQYRAMNPSLTPLGLPIKRLDLDERRAWRVFLDSGMEIVLGREQAAARLQRFINIYPALRSAEPPGIARVDMRYSNGFALQRKINAQ